MRATKIRHARTNRKQLDFFIFLDSFPLTSSGKIDQTMLPNPFDQVNNSQAEAPLTDTEKALYDVVQEVLGIESFSIHDNFITLGGDSILSMQVVSRMKRKDYKLKIKDIIICGDVFHYRDEIAVNSLQIAKQFFDILKEYNIVMITGNHDCYYKDTSCVNSLSLFSGWNNITVIDKLHTEEIYNKTISFVPWGEQIKKIPKCDLIFGHFELENFKMNNFKVCDNGDNPDELLKKSKMIITGHFHLKDERKFKNGKILYLGNPFQMDFGDAESEKGFYVLDFDKIQEPVFYRNTVSPKHKKLLLSELISFDGVTPEIGRAHV